MSATYFCKRPRGKHRQRLNGQGAGQYGKEKIATACENGLVYMIDRKPIVRANLLKKSKHKLKTDES